MFYVYEDKTEKNQGKHFFFLKVCWIICFLDSKAYLHGQMHIQVTYCTSQRIAVIKYNLILDYFSCKYGGGGKIIVLEEFLFF